MNRLSAPAIGATRSTALRWAAVIVGCAGAWLAMRLTFFGGLAGSDDLHYMRFAALWDRVPATGFEIRLLANALVGGSMRLLGRTEAAAILPCALASLAMLGSVLYWCHRYGTIRQAWWAGLLLTVLPIDVDSATTVAPYPIMTALLTVGTVAFLEAGESRWARRLAAWTLSLGMMTHLSGIYYVGSLVLACLCHDRRRFLRPVITLLVVSIVAFAADIAVFQVVYGDALLRLRLSAKPANFADSPIPLFTAEGFNWAFITWPLTQPAFSKAFGITLSACVALMLWQRRRPSKTLCVVLFSGALYWLWMSFGTGLPWGYHPFPRITRFWKPLTLAVMVWFAWLVEGINGRRLRVLIGGGVLGVCVLNLLGSGSWGQNVEISRELLQYVQEHPHMRFLTDYHTLNELYMLNGVEPLPNVGTTDDVPLSRLLDRSGPRLAPAEATSCDGILENHLNLQRTPSFASFVREHGGKQVFASEPRYRPICRLLTPLRRYSWSIRKPPARVVECRRSSVSITGGTQLENR